MAVPHERRSSSRSSSSLRGVPSPISLHSLLHGEEDEGKEGDEEISRNESERRTRRRGQHRFSSPLFLTVTCDPFYPWVTIEEVQKEVSLLLGKESSASFSPSTSQRDEEEEESLFVSSSFLQEDSPRSSSPEEREKPRENSSSIPEVYVQEIWASDLCRDPLPAKDGLHSSFSFSRFNEEIDIEEEEEEKKKKKWSYLLQHHLLQFAFSPAKKKKVLLLMQPDVWLSKSPFPPPVSLASSSSSPPFTELSKHEREKKDHKNEEDEEEEEASFFSPPPSGGVDLALHLNAAVRQGDTDSEADEEEDEEEEVFSSLPSLSMKSHSSTSSRRHEEKDRRRKKKYTKSEREVQETFSTLFRWFRRSLLTTSSSSHHLLSSSSSPCSLFSSPSFRPSSSPVEVVVIAILRFPFSYMRDTHHPLFSFFSSFFSYHLGSSSSPVALKGGEMKQLKENVEEEEEEERDEFMEFLFHLEREKEKLLVEEEEEGVTKKEGKEEEERRERNESAGDGEDLLLLKRRREERLLKRIEDRMKEEREDRKQLLSSLKKETKKKEKRRLLSSSASSYGASSLVYPSVTLHDKVSRVNCREELNRLSTSHSSVSPFERVPLNCFWPSIHVECTCCVCTSHLQEVETSSSSSFCLSEEDKDEGGKREEQQKSKRRSETKIVGGEEEEGGFRGDSLENIEGSPKENSRRDDTDEEEEEHFEDVMNQKKISEEDISLEKRNIRKAHSSSLISPPPTSCLRCIYTTCPSRKHLLLGNEGEMESTSIRSVLIGGPPGSGKSVLMHCLSDILGGKRYSSSFSSPSSSSLHCRAAFHLSSHQSQRERREREGGGVIFTHVADLLQPYVGGSQRKLLEIFASAVSTSPPACVCIEGLDAALGLRGKAWSQEGGDSGHEREEEKEKRERQRKKRREGGNRYRCEKNHERERAREEGEESGLDKKREIEAKEEEESEEEELGCSSIDSGRDSRRSDSGRSESSDCESLYEDFESDEDSPAHEVQRDLAQYFLSLVEVYVHRMGVPLCCTVSVRPESLSPPDMLQCFNKIISLKPIMFCN